MKHAEKAVILFAAALVGAAAQADIVHLKSGSTLKGSVSAVSSDEITFKSDDLGEVKIKRANVMRLENAGEHVIVRKDDSRETKRLSVADGAYVADSKPLDMADVKAIDPAEEKWHGSVNLAFTSQRGNTYENSGSAIANVNRRWEKDRVKADFGYYYSESGISKQDKRKSTDRWEIEGQHDHFWRKAFYSYENARYEQDDIAGLDFRLRLGAGVGYQWLDNANNDLTGKWSFNQEVGVAWIRNDYKVKDPSAEISYATFRYAHHLTFKPKWNEGVEAFHNLEYLPCVNDSEIYLIKADVGFTTKLFMDFDFIGKIEWDYDNVPSAGRKKSDTRYIAGLGYKW